MINTKPYPVVVDGQEIAPGASFSGSPPEPAVTVETETPKPTRKRTATTEGDAK